MMKFIKTFLILFLIPIISVAQKENKSKDQYHESSQHIDLGTFSLSLAVKDIQASFDFYQNLGFDHVNGAGGVDQKWMILKNNNIKIGLFQDMFPSNTMTFHPTNARHIHQRLKEEGVNYLFSNGLDEDEGPCSFSFLDPDGNPVLVDQH